MALSRVLEPEVMDTAEEAGDYDSMDHQEVNQSFVQDLLSAGFHSGDVLDLGTGTARIPIELCRQVPNCRVMAVDLAAHMLDLARFNVEVAGFSDRIQLTQSDAKRLPMADGMFDASMSNSIVHHIPEPLEVLGELVRVTREGGLIFVRDLARPESDDRVAQLVQSYAGNENQRQQNMFEASLRAALTLQEMQQLVRQLGFAASTVAMTSDRHWTWSALRSE